MCATVGSLGIEAKALTKVVHETVRDCETVRQLKRSSGCRACRRGLSYHWLTGTRQRRTEEDDAWPSSTKINRRCACEAYLSFSKDTLEGNLNIHNYHSFVWLVSMLIPRSDRQLPPSTR